MNKPKFDPTSAEPVLYFNGEPLEGTPARDLSGNDLARLAWVASEERPNLPTDVPAPEINALAAQLVKSGSYSEKEPATPAPKPESES